MSVSQTNATAKPPEPASKAVADRRRHARVPVTMLGRFMRASKHEFPCKMIDISVGGAALMSPVEPEMGEKIIAYFDHVGGLEGTVIRQFPGGFAIQFIMTSHKREKLAATLMFLANKSEMPGIESRRHERLTGPAKIQQLTLTEGLSIACDIIDMSLSGASIVTPARPELGTMVKLGNLNARVVRHHDKGIALQFVDVQNPNAIRRYFG
jgi:PilZ domain